MDDFKQLLKGLGKQAKAEQEQQLEQVGTKLRAMMPWLQKGKIVDQTKN